jgi:tetratricopeptide (TPR) repeat protein
VNAVAARLARRLGAVLLAAACSLGLADPVAAQMSRGEALKALEQDDPAERLAGVERLAEAGQMADADAMVQRLRDPEPVIRERAAEALWQIWSRSGDPAIDELFARGVSQMQASAYEEALVTFDEIVRRRPDFAEGWNKRATVYFLLGRFDESLKDVDEVLERNRHHFGALSGAGQIHLRLGHERQALDFFERAFEVNPNLEGLELLIRLLDQHLREEDRHRT